MLSDNETETCRQMETTGVSGNPDKIFKGDVRTGSNKLSFGFGSLQVKTEDKRRAEYELKMQMKDLQFRFRKLGTTGGSDCKNASFPEPLG